MTAFFNYVPFDYSIAVGNNFVAGLVRLQAIYPGDDPAQRPFVAPVAVPGYSPGIRRRRLDRKVTLIGTAKVRWLFSVLTWYQYDYLNTTYCNGLYSGEVTIRTRVGSYAYANYSATINLPFPDEMRQIEMTGYWDDVNIDMTDLELIPDP